MKDRFEENAARIVNTFSPEHLAEQVALALREESERARGLVDAITEISKYTDGPRAAPNGQMLQGKLSEEAQIADEALSEYERGLK
jgi:KaiC/GvpD/RAD55 family RecA-like ATPase